MGWTIERRGRVAVVTMTTNPVNAQNRAFFADPRDAFDRFERDHSDCPVARTGTGRRFSAGLDLDEHFRLFAGDPAAVGSWFADYRATNMRLFTYPRPAVAAVAAVNGYAFAGGLITAAVCDHRIAVTGEAAFGPTRRRSASRCPRSMSACSPTPGASRSLPGPRCSARSSPRPGARARHGARTRAGRGPAGPDSGFVGHAGQTADWVHAHAGTVAVQGLGRRRSCDRVGAGHQDVRRAAVGLGAAPARITSAGTMPTMALPRN